MNKKIDVTDYAGVILKAIPKGVLLTTKADGKLNTMTIGWGALGTNWGKPVFEAFIRVHRSTMELLEKNPEFTINVPLGEFEKRIIGVCGSKRGDEEDKFSLLGLTPVESDVISVPGIKELPLTLECRVIYKQPQELALYEGYVADYYPQDVDERDTGSNKDPHVTFFGEIVNAYIAE